MNSPPIQVQLIHLSGPLMGKIHEFDQAVISLGRHPQCDISFPEDQTIISRRHCELKREGNRYQLIDTSSNGTLVNNKEIDSIYLKNGDVLVIGPGGPKISFLFTILDTQTAEKKSVSTPPPMGREEEKKKEVIERAAEQPLFKEQEPQPSSTVQKSLVIQYGASLHSFKRLPVTIGRAVDCECVIDHPSILERHALISYDDGHFLIKDLTGRNLLSLNLLPVRDEVELQVNASLSLSPQGPNFQFLGDGRLVEVSASTKPPPAKAGT